jgi:hypothetical protein
MMDKFRNNIWPPPPQLSLPWRAALSSNSNGTRSVYCIAERTQNALWDVCEYTVSNMNFPNLLCWKMYEILRRKVVYVINFLPTFCTGGKHQPGCTDICVGGTCTENNINDLIRSAMFMCALLLLLLRHECLFNDVMILKLFKISPKAPRHHLVIFIRGKQNNFFLIIFVTYESKNVFQKLS